MKYLLFNKFGIAFIGCIFIATLLLAAEEIIPRFNTVSEKESTPSKKVLMVKYAQVNKSYQQDIESLMGIFKNMKGVRIRLQRQDKAFPYGGGSVKSADVKAIHDGTTIYFQISWNDPTKDIRAIAVHEFRDTAALMFPLGGVEITPAEHFSPRMGDREKPVNIWHWKADWELDLVAKDGLEDVETQYPNMHDDFVSNPCSQNYHRELMGSAEMLSGGRAAGNLLSQPGRGRVVEDLNAEGFGTLTTQEHQDVNGCSKYADGVWNVIMYRPLITKDQDDIQFFTGGKTYFNVAIWNGGEKDRNGQKSVSMQWRPLLVEKVANCR